MLIIPVWVLWFVFCFEKKRAHPKLTGVIKDENTTGKSSTNAINWTIHLDGKRKIRNQQDMKHHEDQGTKLSQQYSVLQVH